jgi:hypothetical protein
MPVGIKIERRAGGYYVGETRVSTTLGPVDPKLGWPASVEVRRCPVCGMVAATDLKVFPAACETVAAIRRELSLERRCQWRSRSFFGSPAQRMCSDACRRDARVVSWRIASEKRAALRERLRDVACYCQHCRRTIVEAKRLTRKFCSERCRSAARRAARVSFSSRLFTSLLQPAAGDRTTATGQASRPLAGRGS